MVKIDIIMPTYCYDCPCHNGENGRCNITGDSVFDKRPFDCPLREDKSTTDVEEVRRREWISVKERLPIDGNWVVALLWGLVGFNMGIVAYDATKRNFYDEDGIEYDIDDVAYWVGLPEPPEVEG